MKKGTFLIVVLGILVFLTAGCGNKNAVGGNATAGLQTITASQLKAEIKDGIDDNTVIVDLRETVLYKNEHIQGAVLIPFADFEKEYSQLDKSKRIILVCHMGSMGDAAGQFLIEQGYKQVYNLEGGMRAWDQ